jgi:hypothetical protein
MSRKGTGLAVAIAAAIGIGAVVAFASGKKKSGGAAADDDDFDDETDTPVSPVVPSGVTPLGTPPFVPPGIINVSNPTTPPVGPPIVAPPVVLPDLPDDDDEAELPTVLPPMTIPGSVTIPGTSIQVPIPPIPGVTAPPPPAAVPPPPIVAVEQPSLVPADTARLVAMMLAEEGTANWKRKYPELGAWQASRGRVVDQMFGTGDALAMAKEIGTLPIIRYWPKGTTRETALEPFRNSLLTLSATAPEPRRAQLIMAASREQGQSFSAPSSPIRTLINLTQTAAA